MTRAELERVAKRVFPDTAVVRVGDAPDEDSLRVDVQAGRLHFRETIDRGALRAMGAHRVAAALRRTADQWRADLREAMEALAC